MSVFKCSTLCLTSMKSMMKAIFLGSFSCALGLITARRSFTIFWSGAEPPAAAAALGPFEEAEPTP